MTEIFASEIDFPRYCKLRGRWLVSVPERIHLDAARTPIILHMSPTPSEI